MPHTIRTRSIHTQRQPHFSCFFFFNDTATTEIYTLSLHDALPIWQDHTRARARPCAGTRLSACAVHQRSAAGGHHRRDRKSTRLNSSHSQISYAVFCLKKKKKKQLSTCYPMCATSSIMLSACESDL